jgi:dTDP-4-dehydrorhamnose reductase
MGELMQPIVVIGVSSQLGRCLIDLAPDRIIPLKVDVKDCSDVFSKLQRLDRNLDSFTVLNLASYNRVDEAEEDTGEAYNVNEIGSIHVALSCRTLNLRSIFISTNYVFDGVKGSYIELDHPFPLSNYGNSKKQGELPSVNHCVIRTAALYSKYNSSSKGYNFVNKVINNLRNNTPMKITNNEYINPTYCNDLASWILENNDLDGLFHIVNSGSCSWFELAQFVGDYFNKGYLVSPNTPESTIRPLNGDLDTLYPFCRLRSWKEALRAYLETISYL